MESFFAKMQHGAGAIKAPFKKKKDNVRRAEARPDLFALTTGATLGFPQKPSALAYDAQSNLLALATKTGAVRLYGKSGVQLEYELDYCTEIRKLVFLNDARLVCVCANNSAHLLEINFDESDAAKLIKAGCVEVPPEECERSLLITDVCVINDADGQTVALATECGKVLLLLVKEAELALSNASIEPEFLLEHLQETTQPRTIGRLEAIEAQGNCMLLGFAQLIVLYDLSNKSVLAAFGVEQRLLSLSITRSHLQSHAAGAQTSDRHQGDAAGDALERDEDLHFVSAHADGSYRAWSFQRTTNEPGPISVTRPNDPPSVPYGPYACKPITRVIRVASRRGMYTVFGGGLPRSYDNSTVSVVRVCPASDSESDCDKHVAFDFASRVVDFLVVPFDRHADVADRHHAESDRDSAAESDADADADAEAEAERDSEQPQPPRGLMLVVLCDEELVVLDLCAPGWPQLAAPYLHTLHSSAVTCVQHFADVNEHLFVGLTRPSDAESSQSDWFVTGGRPLAASTSADSLGDARSLLLTGHENGAVSFWRADCDRFDLLFTLSTAGLFDCEAAADAERDEADWPPLRRVGRYDPFADDARLCVQRVTLADDFVLVAGAAGQCVLFSTEPQFVRSAAADNRAVPVIASRITGVEWSGCAPLHVRQIEQDPDAERPALLSDDPFGFAPFAVVQLEPAGAISTLEARLDAARMLVALGTSFGFALIDVRARRVLVTHNTASTLSADVMRHHGRSIARFKSLKQSLRQSFRRVRSRRSTRRAPAAPQPAAAGNPNPRNGAGDAEARLRSKQVRIAFSDAQDAERGAVERCIEARSVTNQQDVSSACVRTFHFAECSASRDATIGVCLFVGTNSGTVFAYTVPRAGDADGDALLAKELRLQHGAPVLHLCVLPDDTARSSNHHQTLLVCSEEQVKLFALPSLTPRAKVKLTASDGSRVRRAIVARFSSTAQARESNASQYFLLLVTNQGDALVLGLPSLRLHFEVPCLRRDDVVGINSCVLSSRAVGVFQASPSELRCFTVAARLHDRVASSCTFDFANKRRCAAKLEQPSTSPKRIESTKRLENASTVRDALPSCSATNATQAHSNGNANDNNESEAATRDGAADKA